MIPKVIHYCWFGGKPIPKKFLRYMKTWRKFFPDYEIKRWDESNFDINCCDYIKEAYAQKKYAFVSDFARFKILYENGGVYFDTDVEIIKSFEDIISKGGFLGRELPNTINPGLGLAAEAHNPLLGELLNEYYSRHFINEDGSLNLKTIVQYTTEALVRHGLKHNDEIQNIEGINVYPKDFLNPYDFDAAKFRKTKNTHSIHHYSASWESKGNRFRGKVYNLLSRLFGQKFAAKVRSKIGRK